MFVLGLIILVCCSLHCQLVWANNETTATTESTSTFVSIGSNLKNITGSQSEASVGTATNTSVGSTVVAHAVNAQARKIEITKLSSVDAAAASSLKNQAIKATPSGAIAISTTTIAIIVALIAVIIVSVVVGTAVFVMRRRFSVWRLNNSKQNLNEIGGGGSSSNCDGGESGSAASSNEEMIKSSSTSSASPTGVDNVVADATTVAESAAAIVEPSSSTADQLKSVENKNAVGETSTKTTTAESQNVCMITTTTTAATIEIKNEGGTDETKPDQPQDLSSQSLIVNVLNELSESIANKLDAKSPSAKSNGGQAQPDNTQLNTE